MPNLNDLIDTPIATGYVRQLLTDGFPDLGVLDDLFPAAYRPDNKWKWDTTQLKDEPAVSYRAFDTELQIGDRQGVSRSETELPPFGKKKILTEEHKLRLEAIRRNGDYTDVIDQIYDDLRNLVRGVGNRMLLDKGYLLTHGSLTVAGQPINGTPEFTVSVNYNVPGGQIVTASPLWSDTVNSDPLSDLINWEQVYFDNNNGEKPAEWLINSTIRGYLVRNAAFRAALYGNANYGPSTISIEQVNSVLVAHGVAPLRVVAAKATNESGTKVNAIDQTKAIAVPASGLANMALGTTAEALGMVEAGTIKTDEAPGIVGLSWDANDPPRRFNGVTGVGMPVLQNPQLLMIATVTA